MSGALYGAILISVCAQVLLCCFSDDVHGVGRYVRAVFSVCVLCLLLSPLYQALTVFKENETSSADGTDDIQAGGVCVELGETLVIERTISTLCQAVQQSIALQFSIPQNCITVEIEMDDHDHTAVALQRIYVTITGEEYRILDEKIERFLKEKFFTECEVLVL